MSVSVTYTFKNLESTEALKRHVQEKCEKLAKFVRYPIEAHAFLSIEKTYHRAEITLRAEHKPMAGDGRGADMYEAIDVAAHRIEAQLKKERERKKGHASAHLSQRGQALHLAEDVKADLPHQDKKRRA